jgi:hypothetical protein
MLALLAVKVRQVYAVKMPGRCHLALHGDLISGDLALEEIGQLTESRLLGYARNIVDRGERARPRQ